MLKPGDFLSEFSDNDHLSQQKVKIPTTYGKAPTRTAGRCFPRGGALATPALYPALFSPPGSPATFGCADFAGWHTPATRFGHGCACGERRLVTFRTPSGPHSGTQAVTLSAYYRCEVRERLRLADAQPPHLSAPTAVRRTGRGPAGSDGWCRADCRCASDQPWW